MALQKPRPERCPITDPSLPPRTTACCQPLRNAASKRPTARCRPQAGRPRVASFLRRSPRRVDHGQRARLPQSKALGSNRRSCAKQPTPSVELAAALASTRAQRSLKVVTAVGPSPGFASRAAPRARTACEFQARATQSSAAKLWAQASAAATFTRQTLLRLNLLQLQRSASASDKIAAAFA